MLVYYLSIQHINFLLKPEMEGILISCCELKTLKQCSRTANQVVGSKHITLETCFVNVVFSFTSLVFYPLVAFGLVYQFLNLHISNLEKIIEITDITFRHSIHEETLQRNQALHLASHQVLPCIFSLTRSFSTYNS
jgi:hypothetical protein